MTDSRDAALKILALVDEYPSEPFSYERKQIEDKIKDLIARHAEQIDNERDESYALGYEMGQDEGRREAEEEYDCRIQELEDELRELKEEQEQKYQDAVAEGYEAARIEYGLN